jgi:hypothetical protein
LAVHELRRGGVLRDLGAKRANPAALFHHLAPPAIVRMIPRLSFGIVGN